MNSNLFKSFYLAIGIFLSNSDVATAQTQVIVNGQTEFCYGDCTGAPPSMNVGYPTMGGGGSSGYNTPAGYDDSSRGKQPIYNRQAGCQREILFYYEVVNALAYGLPPVGIVIMDTFGDPKYQDAGWRKYQTGRYYSQFVVSTGRSIEYYTQIHYMYNIYTKQFDQAKLKTSYEYGCIGIPKAVGT